MDDRTSQVAPRHWLSSKPLFRIVRRLLADPATAGLDPDSAETTLQRRQLILKRGFLRRIYDEWYGMIAAALPQIPGPVLEVGSGGGFMGSAISGLITSDVLPLTGIDVVTDAAHLPFGDESLRAIVMTNVFHHLPVCSGFLREFARCAKSGSVLIMIEPWVTTWSKRVFGTLHHEPFDIAATQWGVEAGAPLSEANGALPWIIFQRDREVFESDFPELVIETIQPMMPLRYLVSGGVSMRSFQPAWTFPLWEKIDAWLSRWSPETAMFALLVVRRRDRA